MNQMSRPITHHEALIYVMVTLSAADRKMTDKELLKIGDIVRQVPIFADFDPNLLVSVAEDCGRRLQVQDGLEKMLDTSATALPERLYETAYARAIEVAAADLRIEDQRERLGRLQAQTEATDVKLVLLLGREAVGDVLDALLLD